MDIGSLRRISQELADAADAVEFHAGLEFKVVELEARQKAAESGYQLAHNERAQIIEAIENLKHDHTVKTQALADDLEAQKSGFEQAVSDARENAAKRIYEVGESVAYVEQVAEREKESIRAGLVEAREQSQKDLAAIAARVEAAIKG